MEGESFDQAFSTSFSVACSPALFMMVKVAISFRIKRFFLMGLVAKTPHPAPGAGFNSIGTSSGILMLRYARRESESVSPVYGTLDTYDVVQT